MENQRSLQNSKEIKLSEIKPILSRTDLKGTIKYCNKYFQEISGYSEHELIGAPHNIIRHPDMPKVIFKLMWERLKQNQDILAVVKNLSKSGDYYWVTTLFETKYHPFTKAPEGYLALRKAAPKKAVETVIPLYKTLIEIEKNEGVAASEDYLYNFLREQNKDYDTFMRDLVNYKGLIAKFFEGMSKMFA
ncbi:PAS domain-containing protein [Sulfurimonas microaerophilic]|uniref:PAS domain-containing protein n=1 Tax=Sulfurimonas microaerophilic TaxID=3058392 RepID=UPI002714E7B2|nr:PAS domain-containing protein [Sulfurimonas sp. hsl 1-7]